ncbi:MAG: signal peptidase II [Deltaproteobacteria bacterium]|nr:signal peptidase II [Deltaproteobacteria bacterium]
MKLSPAAWKWVLLVVLSLATLGGDLATKVWAEDRLASRDHPLLVELEPGDVGRPLEEVLAARVGGTLDPRWAVPAPAALGVDPDARLLDTRLLDRHPAFLVQEEGDRTARVVRNELLDRLRAAGEGENRSAVRDRVELELQDESVATYLAGRVPGLDREAAHRALEEGRVRPYPALADAAGEDRTVKAAGTWLVFDRRITLIPGALQFVYAENPGAAWGFLRDVSPGVRRTFLGGVSLLAMFFILFLYRSVPSFDRVSQVALAALLGGAMGNFWERLVQGYVVDFIDMYIGDSHWPTYNVADIGISVGVGLLLLQMLRKKSPFDTAGRPAAG